MGKHTSRFAAIFAGILLPIFGSLLLTEAAFAPTNQIQILGATVAEQKELDNLVSYDLSQPDPQGIKAASYLVEDYDSGQIIAGKQIDNSLPIASLTKLMTVWTTLEHVDPGEIIEISPADQVNVSPSLDLKAGDKVAVQDLIQSILVGSANDAANVLGGYVSRKLELPFSELMNQEAVQLGMKNSRFSNPMGFDSAVNYSSARDLALLVRKLNEKALFEDSSKAPSYEFRSALGNIYSVQATNKLTGLYSDLSAVKTGYTNLALGAMINFLDTGGTKKLLIVIGSSDREGDTLQLRKQFLNR